MAESILQESSPISGFDVTAFYRVAAEGFTYHWKPTARDSGKRGRGGGGELKRVRIAQGQAGDTRMESSSRGKVPW